MKLVDLIRDNNVNFSHIARGAAYYNIYSHDDDTTYQFPVPFKQMSDKEMYRDVESTMKFLKWIRLSIENKTFVKAVIF